MGSIENKERVKGGHIIVDDTMTASIKKIINIEGNNLAGIQVFMTNIDFVGEITIELQNSQEETKYPWTPITFEDGTSSLSVSSGSFPSDGVYFEIDTAAPYIQFHLNRTSGGGGSNLLNVFAVSKKS